MTSIQQRFVSSPLVKYSFHAEAHTRASKLLLWSKECIGLFGNLSITLGKLSKNQ
jgi:hypothetical protein